ncbi:MAG: isoprenylcysteine carboxylmethyltransferase family protein [Euryarchaeota archaeon]|nr:isoprenylcysteine carboxylmethyltransferase family protein [Euryarchaeota archaeon]
MKPRHIAVEIMPRVLWIIMAICLYMFQHFANEPPIFAENILLRSFGIPLVIGGLLIRMYVGYYMRRALFYKTLVTDGQFGYVRHPMYLGIYVMLFGIGLLLFSHVWFAVMLAFVPIWYPDGRVEKMQMIELYGSAYLDYRERTGMLIPKIWMKE